MDIEKMKCLLIISLICFSKNIKAQNYLQDSIAIENFVKVSWCGSDYVRKDSLSVDMANPKTLHMLLDNIYYSCFTGYEEMAPIFSYLSEQIEEIPIELIISKIQRGALENSFYLELLNVKLKSLESSGALALFEEDFKLLDQQDQIRFKEILIERSIELIKKDNGK